MSERQYALVDGDKVLFIGAYTTQEPDPGDFSDQYPAGSKWLPIANVDDRPFDASKHCRLAPHYRVTGDHVERVYPIVNQGGA